MKKLLITSLLGLFGFFGVFASADTVGGFTSNDTISSFSISDSQMYSFDELLSNGWSMSDFYACISSEDTPFYWGFIYGNGDDPVFYVNSPVYCSSELFYAGDYYFNFYSSYSTDSYTSKSINGTLYLSKSPITYNSPSDGGDNSGSLLPGGESDLSGIITGLNSTINEFIPYLVYLGLGIITVIIGFVAVRWLINRTQAKIRGTFSSGRRRR